MKYLIYLLCLFVLQTGLAQSTSTVMEKYPSQKIKAVYQIKAASDNTKHGDYQSFFSNGQLRASGQYQNNKKEGQWLTYYENGQWKERQHFAAGMKIDIWEKSKSNGSIITRYDHDQQKALPPVLVTNLVVSYPPLAREYEIEGDVTVAISYNDSCLIESYQIIRSIGHGCDEAVLSAVEKLVHQYKYYQAELWGCVDKTDTCTVEFRLR